MLDTDDFFDPSEKELHHYVNNWCKNRSQTVKSLFAMRSSIKNDGQDS